MLFLALYQGILQSKSGTIEGSRLTQILFRDSFVYFLVYVSWSCGLNLQFSDKITIFRELRLLPIDIATLVSLLHIKVRLQWTITIRVWVQSSFADRCPQ